MLLFGKTVQQEHGDNIITGKKYTKIYSEKMISHVEEILNLIQDSFSSTDIKPE